VTSLSGPGVTDKINKTFFQCILWIFQHILWRDGAPGWWRRRRTGGGASRSDSVTPVTIGNEDDEDWDSVRVRSAGGISPAGRPAVRRGGRRMHGDELKFGLGVGRVSRPAGGGRETVTRSRAGDPGPGPVFDGFSRRSADALAGCIRVHSRHPATYRDAGSSDSDPDSELKVKVGQLEFGPA
jgi:hypothetical protein